MKPEASRHSECILVDMGIDWLTLTTTDPKTKREMHDVFNRIAIEQRNLGFVPVPGGHHGFKGEKLEHATLARNEDREMLVLSSHDAKRTGLHARIDDHCTRIDVQCTVRVGEQNVSKYLARQEKRCCGHRSIRGHVPEVVGERRDMKMAQVKIGSRQSEVFVRLYDKYRESKDERYRGCVRLEVEYKGKKSQALWEHMAVTGDGVRWLVGVTLEVLSERGVDVAMIDLDRQDVVRPKPTTPKENRTWGWWASQVAPSVARSVGERGWYTAFSVLFGKALTEFDKTAIMNSLSIAWGN